MNLCAMRLLFLMDSVLGYINSLSSRQSQYLKNPTMQVQSPSSPQDHICHICLNELIQPIETKCHSRSLCKKCWTEYLIVAVQEMSYKAGKPIKCPVCEDSFIEPDLALGTLDRDFSEKIGQRLLDGYVRQTQDIQRCPLSRCRFAFLPEKCGLFSQRELQCPMCFTSLSSRFSFSLVPIVTFIYITFMTNNCPKCQIPIDRVSGCYHMTCSCGHQFCWYCLKNYHNVRRSQYRQHNQGDCLFLLLTKVLTLWICAMSLLLVVSGVETFNWVVSCLISGLGTVVRVLLTDGALLAEIMVLMRMNSMERPFKKLVLIFLLADVMTGMCLGYLGELAYTLVIIGLSLAVALSCLGIGLLVDFSVVTWFNYIQ